MNEVNKTLYIPLYGKAYVSKKGILLKDITAELLWEKEGFPLKRKSKSKWLAYYMGMRSAVFDAWLKKQRKAMEDAMVVHIGCGMDSRIHRVGENGRPWYDVDFPEVIEERKKYFSETEFYHMISSDARNLDWIAKMPKGKPAIVLMEGVSMYLERKDLLALLKALKEHLGDMVLLMDCYTQAAAKASKYKNPIQEVGVTLVYGIDNPKDLEEGTGLCFLKEKSMTPEALCLQLPKQEQKVFRFLYAGKIARSMYRLYEFKA